MDSFSQFISPDSDNSKYALQQRRSTLNRIIWIIFIICIPLALTNYLYGSILAALVILLLSPICLIAYYLNNKNKYFEAGVLISCFLLFAIVYDILDAGGLRSDMGATAFPVFIAICGLLFGKRGIFFYSIIAITIILIIGIVELGGLSKEVGHTDIFDVTTVIILVFGMAIILWVIIDNNIKNLQQIHKNKEILQLSNELTLESLAKALEYRDLETKNHSNRVVEMSVILARFLGLPDEELQYIRHGALLHDIGKLAIPDNILQKTGKLTTEEWVIMKTHPAKAFEILEPIPILKSALVIPYCHHENWDGSGYPQGLKENQIPLYARIFTIIDQWEALTDDRIYRKAWPYEEVIKYIKNNSGKIYDPQIASIFLQLVKNNPASFQSDHLEGPIPVNLL
jgi:hypothetical protein